MRSGLPPGFPSGERISGKEFACNAGDAGVPGSIPGQGDPMKEGMVIHSSILARKISWIEEPGGLWSMESQRVRHH